MTAIEVPVESMPLSERVSLLSRIWETLPPEGLTEADWEMPQSHAELLQERLKEAEEGRGEWVDLAEARERVARLFT
ncbi:MAG: hypothetical protein JWO94_3701 [Verrucomicrobiaceae bacterium]|nr:hypothetical protein [Verrucomicrobiaceae bacterium]